MVVETCSKRVQMFILEISWRLVCGQPCGARPYMKGNARFECRDTNMLSKLMEKCMHTVKG